MNVSAVLVTRGDVELTEIVHSFVDAGIPEIVVWNNGTGECLCATFPTFVAESVASGQDDLAVYGRYAGIEHATGDLIYVQDDDVLHTPEGIREMIRSHYPAGNLVVHDGPDSYVTCNMPAAFRARHFYDEHSLVGFGAVFHRDLPQKAFDRYMAYVAGNGLPPQHENEREWFNRTCDIVFTALTPRVLVDIDYQDMPWASADNRMWKQQWHQEIRSRMLELVLKVRNPT